MPISLPMRERERERDRKRETIKIIKKKIQSCNNNFYI